MSGHRYVGVRVMVHSDRPALMAVCACGELGVPSVPDSYTLELSDVGLRATLYPHLKESAMQALEDNE